MGAKFYLDDYGTVESVTKDECEEYQQQEGISNFLEGNWSDVPDGCTVNGDVYWREGDESNVQCGMSNHKCIKKSDDVFVPYSPPNHAIDINECAKICRDTYKCGFYSVENGVCYMHDGCDIVGDGDDEIYQLMSPEGGRAYTHFAKSKPTLCMSPNGLNFDETTQAPVIRAVNALTTNCTDGYIFSKLEQKCVLISTTPRFETTFFLDKGTEYEKSLDAECQILSNTTARCALCTCFADYVYGKWAGFSCDTCNLGYGKSQCRAICPDFDGDNRATMCGGFGTCLFGSEFNLDNGERIFQESRCICGQSSQYAERQPTEEVTGTYESTGGIDNDGAQVGYYYFTPVPYLQTYLSRFEAQEKCNEFNDLDNVDRGGFCFGVYRKYLSVTAVSTEVYLNMGYIGGSYYLYGKFWEKKAISGYAKFYNFKSLELYNAIEGLPNIQTCKDILAIRSEGFDTCNHFTEEDENPSCTTCDTGWTGKNCRVVCQKCLLGGACAGVPSESMTSSCSCPQGSGALWEHQCCPVGFMVADKVTWQSKTQADVDSIRLSLTYDSSTTNELDAAYYCKTCPGVSYRDWMSPDALYKVCSGPTRGECQPVVGKLELACNCRINSVTKNRWLGRACSCDESIVTPYSLNPETAESTDYGCLIPTEGRGVCPTSTDISLFFNPPRIWGQDAEYIAGFSQGQPFLANIAGQVFAKRTMECNPGNPCHTGEGHCNSDEDCAGTLKCFIRTDGEEKLSFNNEKIEYDLSYCYHEQETMVGCHPADYDAYLNTREYNKQFYWNLETTSFEAPVLGEYIPYTQDANLNFVIQQQAFPCPKGRFGITVPNKVEYELLHTSGLQCDTVNYLLIYEGNVAGDNPGSFSDQVQRCFEGCMNKRTPIETTGYLNSWDSRHTDHFLIQNGRCFCGIDSWRSCEKKPAAYSSYRIKNDGEWQVCEMCQPGKFQNTTGNIAWVKIRDGNNIGKSIPLNECETYAKWHVLPFNGPPYANAGFPHGCFIHSSGIYYQSDPSTVECSDDAVCLQYGGKGDTHANCLNCPLGKFGGPIASWDSMLCEVCPPGTRQSEDGLSCIDCVAGKYELGGICRDCPNGQFSAQRHPGTPTQPCNNCPLGKDTNGQIGTPGANDKVCRFCPPGSANGVPGRDCIPCAPGKHASTRGKPACDLCDTQEFANVPGMVDCKLCGEDAPYYGLFGHTDNRQTCEQCSPGEFINEGACYPCTAGKQQPVVNQPKYSCTSCAIGRFASSAGTGTCSACELGKFQSETGQVTCEQCIQGTYADTVGHSACKLCAAGKYTNAPLQSSCKNCAPGQFNGNTGQSTCVPCYPHTYEDRHGSSACKNCPAGRANAATSMSSVNQCSYCPAGKSTGGGSACTDCGPGSFASGSGNSGCTQCPTGHYNNGWSNSGCTTGCAAKEGTAFCSGRQCACYRNRGVGSNGCTGFLDYNLYFTQQECTQSCIAKYCWNDGGACGTVWDSCGTYASRCASGTVYYSGQYMWWNAPYCPGGRSRNCCKTIRVCAWIPFVGERCTGGNVDYGNCGSNSNCVWGCCRSNGHDAGYESYCSAYCPKSEGHCFAYTTVKHYWNWGDC